jgi:hypothetical protein
MQKLSHAVGMRFKSHQNVQTSSGANLAIPWGQEALAQGVKPPGSKADHLLYLMLKLRLRTAVPLLPCVL